jgi:hypothetical protein
LLDDNATAPLKPVEPVTLTVAESETPVPPAIGPLFERAKSVTVNENCGDAARAGAEQFTLIVYAAAAVDVVVEIVTGVEAPAVEGVTLNDVGVTVTAVDEEVTEHVTEAAVPLVRVTTTFGLGVTLLPATTEPLAELQATL